MPHYNFVIPYRSRPDSLKLFLEEFPIAIKQRDYITSFNIIIVEQEDGKPFNLGKLLNCGFDYLKNSMMNYEYSPWDIFCFHPVDKLPTETTDYRHEDIGLCWLVLKREHPGYPKATIMQNCYMEKINGYCNQFFHYGADDEEQGYRCEISETNYLIREADFIDIESRSPKGFPYKIDSSSATEIINDLRVNKNIYYSGLNTLQYTKLEEHWLDNNIVKILVKI